MSILVKATVFPVVMCGCESWTIKKAERQRIDAFKLWCWRRLLRVLWAARRSNQSAQEDMSVGVHTDCHEPRVRDHFLCRITIVVMHRCASWTIEKTEHQRIDAFRLWCLRRLLRVSWTARRSSQTILKKINPNIHWKGWCWSWSSNNLATWCKELTH